jgi:hypothetical protein
MPPTFLLYIALVFYLFIAGASILIFIPILLIRAKRLFAKKVLITVLISLPCLITVGILLGLLFLLPALLFSWLANNNYISQSPGIILIIAGLLLFGTLVVVCSLYIWYFFSQIIYKLLENKPVFDFLDSNKVFQYLQPRFKLTGTYFQKNGIIKIICMLIIVPICAIIGACAYEEFSGLTFAKPTQLELVGKYHISEATVRNFDKSTFNKFKLEFKRDSTFELTPTPNIEVCSKGKYKVDYQFYYNEISLECENMGKSAHIDRHYGYYRIEFIIGDPDSGESIFFEKNK